jgi:DNA-directed RNA polymerase
MFTKNDILEILGMMFLDNYQELHDKLPEAPAKGDLDIQQLRDSEFFFA